MKAQIKDLREQLFLGDYGDQVVGNGYNSGYISDTIQELADSNTSIYYSDQLEFAKENSEWVERAINEFGWDGCGSDLYKAYAMGEYLKISDDLYNNLDDIVKDYAYNYLLEKGITELDKESEVYDLIDLMDGNDYNKWVEIDDAIDDALE